LLLELSIITLLFTEKDIFLPKIITKDNYEKT